MLNAALLDTFFLGKNISKICPNGYVNNADNHCAHFVAHALNLSFGVTCRQLVSPKNQKATGATVRVHEIFAQCPNVRELNETPARIEALVFISAPTNFVTKGSVTTLTNVPRKHIGILLDGVVWHYSNTKDKVVKVPVGDMLNHYPGQTNALWVGDLPPGSAAFVCK
jgi:hypothetical protein